MIDRIARGTSVRRLFVVSADFRLEVCLLVSWYCYFLFRYRYSWIGGFGMAVFGGCIPLGSNRCRRRLWGCAY